MNREGAPPEGICRENRAGFVEKNQKPGPILSIVARGVS